MGRLGCCPGKLAAGDLVSSSGESDCDGKGTDVPDGLGGQFRVQGLLGDDANTEKKVHWKPVPKPFDLNISNVLTQWSPISLVPGTSASMRM